MPRIHHKLLLYKRCPLYMKTQNQCFTAQCNLRLWWQSGIKFVVSWIQKFVKLHQLNIVYMKQKCINVITVHDMELKSAHHSNVTIKGWMVQVKQDTGAEINIMSKCVFDKLNISSSTTRNSVMLNRYKTVKITGYGENSIEYIGTWVFKVSTTISTKMFYSSSLTWMMIRLS